MTFKTVGFERYFLASAGQVVKRKVAKSLRLVMLSNTINLQCPVNALITCLRVSGGQIRRILVFSIIGSQISFLVELPVIEFTRHSLCYSVK